MKEKEKSKMRPKPTIEVLTSRLINREYEKPSNPEDLQKLDENKLLKEFEKQTDLPNRTTEFLLKTEEERYKENEKELNDLLGEDDEDDEKSKMDISDPKQVKEYLDRFIEGQDEAKKAISVAFVDYMVHSIRKGVLLIGPSGSGKTYIFEVLKRMSEELGMELKVVKKSVANVSSEGFKGQNLSEGLEELVGAEKGILFLDELDKIAIDSNEISGFAQKLQNELLAYFTGEKIKLANMALPIGAAMGQTVSKKPLTKAKIYTYEVLRNTDPAKAENYIKSLNDFLLERGIETEVITVEDGFKEIPREAKAKLEKQVAKATRNDVFGGATLVIEIEGSDKYLVNPKERELENAIREVLIQKAKEAKKKMKEEDPLNVIDLSKYLIVTAGAFHGRKGSPSLYQIIQRRLGGNTCKLDETEVLRHVGDQDLIEYGFKPELIGRLHCREVLKPHSIEGLYKILKYSEDSPLDRLQKIFDKIGMKIKLDDPSLLLLAEYASQGIGVRGIHKMLDEILNDYSFNRSEHIGKVLNFTRSDLEKLLKKKIEFIKRDAYEVDWNDVNSIVGYMNLFVPNQIKAKRELAKAFHFYHLRLNSKDQIELPLANILVAGPTGSGKTYMINLLAKKAGLPIGTTNMTGKVPEGIVGTRLADVFEQFSENQKYGIVCIDEVDKVVLEPGNTLNSELIGMLESGEVRGRRTDNYLFVLSGAFQQLYKVKQKVGDDTLSKEDLASVGVREELLGRIPIIVNVEAPTIETMKKVLEGTDSPLEEYQNYFKAMGYKLELEKEVTQLMAGYGVKSEAGFRTLKSLSNKLFDEYMFNTKRYSNEETKTLTVKLEDAKRILARDE